jgi:hypothetical protein
MLPITRSTESNGQDFTPAGVPTTSVKGAKYAMQVMPATARKPGFGIRPAANDSPEEYNRVGTELLGKLTEKYGDPAKAWAAYNGGTGRVDHALAKHGDAWLAAHARRNAGVRGEERCGARRRCVPALAKPRTWPARSSRYSLPARRSTKLPNRLLPRSPNVRRIVARPSRCAWRRVTSCWLA